MSFLKRIRKAFGGRAPTERDRTFHERTEEFWAWWQSISEKFATDIDEGRAADWAVSVGKQLARVDQRLAWETGPGRKSNHHLAITGEGDYELRVLAGRVLSHAPQPDERWEYYAARQAAEGDPVWKIEFEDGTAIDYARIRVGIQPDDNWHLLDLEIYHPQFASIAHDDATRAAFLFLDMLLGEDDVERWIGAVDVSNRDAESWVLPEDLRHEVAARAAEHNDSMVSIVKMVDQEAGRELFASWRTGLKRLDYLLYDHHVEVLVELPSVDERGLCDNAELEALADLEDELLEDLADKVVFFGHVTGYGKRAIRFQALADGAYADPLGRWIERHPEYDIDYTVSADPNWEAFRHIPGSIATL